MRGDDHIHRTERMMTTPGGRVVFTERDRTDEEAARLRSWADRLEQLRHLHRYTTLAGDGMTWFEKLVLESEMYFTPFEKLNDPFDGAVRPVLDDATDQQMRDFWLGWFAEQGKTPDADDLRQIEHLIAHARDPDVQARVRAIHDEEVQGLGVRCFSEEPDDLTMWAHYANSHEGVCLRFRTTLMVGWGGFPPMPVEYGISRPSFYQDTRFKRIYRMIAAKAPVWSHEQEWRMVRPHGKVNFPPAALDRVIMGCRIEPKVQEQVRAVVERREPKLEMFKARPDDREFRLIIEPAT